jgi:hypothetical protein
MGRMDRGAADLTKIAVAALALTSGGVWALHMTELPAMVAVASAGLLLLSIARVTPQSPKGGVVAAAAATFALGLLVAWVTAGVGGRAARVVHDIGWTQAALGAWLVYTTAASTSAGRRARGAFGDAARARWRAGDARFATELARRIVAGAQPHWAALVLETAWPEPRPALVEELLRTATTASPKDVAELRARMADKGGAGIAEARWELARTACEVIEEAGGREDAGDVGGAAASRFVVAAAGAARDDEDAARIFAALVLPAVARRA